MSVVDSEGLDPAETDLEGSSFLFGANSAFIEQLYQRFLNSPSSVDASWQQFFNELGDEAEAVVAEVRGAPWAPRTGLESQADPYTAAEDGQSILEGARRAPGALGAVSPAQIRQATLDSLRALMLIRNFRVRGHLHAKLDPLGLQKMVSHSELDPGSFGFT